MPLLKKPMGLKNLWMHQSASYEAMQGIVRGVFRIIRDVDGLGRWKKEPQVLIEAKKEKRR